MKNYGRLLDDEFSQICKIVKEDGNRTTGKALKAAKSVLVGGMTQEKSATLNKVAVRTVKNAVCLIWNYYESQIEKPDGIPVIIELPDNVIRVFAPKEAVKFLLDKSDLRSF